MENLGFEVQTGIDIVKEQVELLSKTEGWSKLSPKQQQYIKISLYITQRAMRDLGRRPNRRYVDNFRYSDEVGILKLEETVKPILPTEYEASQDNIANWNCAHSIYVLENDGVETLPAPQVDPHFIDSVYEKHKSVDELESRIDLIGFPCIVQLREPEEGDWIDYDQMIHNFLVLGKIGDDYICWEKVDTGVKYNVRKLATIFQRNNKDYRVWGVRKIRKLTNGDEVTSTGK